MIILPSSRTKLLMPIPKYKWRTPSQSQPKDQFGNENQIRFRVRARLNDGYIKWVGWFDDREDFDRFLFSIIDGTLWTDPYVQKLPTPFWPGLDPLITYDFATVTFIVSPTGSTQTYTSPIDWNNANNIVECLGSGATGGLLGGANGHPCGGGGGSYSKITNFSFAAPGTTTATCQVATGGATFTTSSATTGNNGNPSWFNNATNPGVGSDNTKCSAAGGTGGAQGTGSQSGGAGGATASSWGQTKNAGGRGGNLTGASGSGGSGGGGAGGGTGAGNQGVDSSSTVNDTVTNGGSGDAGSGGTAGASAGGNGGAGSEWDGSHGSGGGGGGISGGAPQTSGAGGLYGAASAGNRPTGGGTGTVPAGKQGIVVTTYTPAPFAGFNLTMLGM